MPPQQLSFPEKEHPVLKFLWEEVCPHPLAFVRMLISPGGPSVSRTVTVMTAFFINLEVLILVRASTHGVQNTPALTILAGLLSALIGYVYHRAKSNEERQAHKFPSLKKNIPGF